MRNTKKYIRVSLIFFSSLVLFVVIFLLLKNFISVSHSNKSSNAKSSTSDRVKKGDSFDNYNSFSKDTDSTNKISSAGASAPGVNRGSAPSGVNSGGSGGSGVSSAGSGGSGVSNYTTGTIVPGTSQLPELNDSSINSGTDNPFDNKPRIIDRDISSNLKNHLVLLFAIIMFLFGYYLFYESVQVSNKLNETTSTSINFLVFTIPIAIIWAWAAFILSLKEIPIDLQHALSECADYPKEFSQAILLSAALPSMISFMRFFKLMLFSFYSKDEKGGLSSAAGGFFSFFSLCSSCITLFTFYHDYLRR